MTWWQCTTSDSHDLLSETTTFVHANGIGDDELRMLADAGSSVSISPDVEAKMGFGWPETGRVLPAPRLRRPARSSRVERQPRKTG